MVIDKKTRKFFSVASHPGSFGASMYNYIFEKTCENAVYLPLGFPKDTPFYRIFDALRFIDAQGINVSMPFKHHALQSCISKSPGCININTMVKENGHWSGYNTDCDGFYLACATFLPEIKTANIVGNGAVAKSIRTVLAENNIKCRNLRVGDGHPQAELLINATPLGMEDVPDTYFTDKIVTPYSHVFDVVVKHKTSLIQLCRRLQKKYVPGYMMSMYQLMEQYKLHFPFADHKHVEVLVQNQMKDLGYEIQ